MKILARCQFCLLTVCIAKFKTKIMPSRRHHSYNDLKLKIVVEAEAAKNNQEIAHEDGRADYWQLIRDRQ